MKNKMPLVLVVVISLFLGLLLSTARLSAVSVPGRETPLNPDGLAHEVFRDASGVFWISDFYSGEIWAIDASSGAYTVYAGLSGASSGRTDQAGNLWWSDFDENAVGFYKPGETQATVWALPEDGSPLGLAIDDDQRIWIADAFEPNLYRLDPVGNQLCQYEIPNAGAADYLTIDDGRVWLGDTVLGRLLRFDPDTNTFRVWSLASGAYPQGLAVDDAGQVYWADAELGTIGRLNAQTNQAVFYTVPGPDPQPISVSLEPEGVWYSDYSGFIGRLDVAVSQGQQVTLNPASVQVNPSCAALGAGSQIPVTQRSGTAVWSPVSYDIAVDANGWRIYELPVGSRPWGMVSSEGDAWFVDQGDAGSRLQQFAHLDAAGPPQANNDIYLPAVVKP